MSHRTLDLVKKIIVTLLLLALALVAASFTPVKTLLALPFVFFLPGYALTAALFVERPPDFLERVILSLGLSITIVALAGFILNLTPWGMQPVSWALLLGVITLGLSIVAHVRRKEQRSSVLERPVFTIGSRQTLLFGLTFLIFTGTLAVARVGISREQRPGFTQLWMQPVDGADQNAIRLGVTSHEVSAVTYQLHLKVGGNVLVEWESIELEPGEQWETTVVLPAWLIGSETLEGVLYRSDAPGSVFRRVTWWRAR
jgi:uncharacterized membrane protein